MRFLKYLILLFFAFIIFTSCEKKEEEPFLPNQEDFYIKLDSVSIPEKICRDSTFEIRYFGKIGPDSCYSFKEFLYDFRYRIIENENTLEKDTVGQIIIEVKGTHDLDTKDCKQGEVYLNEQHKQIFAISRPGLYVWIFKQPDYFFFEKVLIVEEK